MTFQNVIMPFKVNGGLPAVFRDVARLTGPGRTTPCRLTGMTAEFLPTGIAAADVPLGGLVVADVRGARVAIANVDGAYYRAAITQEGS
jgi:hypothetical protein